MTLASRRQPPHSAKVSSSNRLRLTGEWRQATEEVDAPFHASKRRASKRREDEERGELGARVEADGSERRVEKREGLVLRRQPAPRWDVGRAARGELAADVVADATRLEDEEER